MWKKKSVIRDHLMPNCDSRDGFLYQHLILMNDTYHLETRQRYDLPLECYMMGFAEHYASGECLLCKEHY